MDKASWAQFNSEQSIVIPWTARKDVPAKSIYSSGIVASLTPFDSTVTSALQHAVSSNRKIPQGTLNLGVPGTTKTIIPPSMAFSAQSTRASGGATIRSYSLLDKNRFASVNVARMFSETMEALPEPTPTDLSGMSVKVAIPLTADDFGPTPPVYSINVKVSCEDLEQYRSLLATKGAVVQYSGCENEAPDITSMDVQFDPLMSRRGSSPAMTALAETPDAESGTAASEGPGHIEPQSTKLISSNVPGHWLTAEPPGPYMEKLAKVLAREPPTTKRRVPLLVVIDDGFPSQAAYADTVKFFDEADAYLRRENAIKVDWYAQLPSAPEGFSALDAELANFPTNTGPPRGLPNCPSLEAASCSFHAKGVQKSLSLFTSIVGGRAQPVHVIWIPLFFAQPGALHQAYRILRFYAASPDEHAKARTPFSQEALSDLRAQFFSEMMSRGVLYPRSEADWKISRPYFSSVLYYLRTYSYLSKTPVFVNLSWRTRVDNATSIPGRGQSYVFLVAAAGNPCTPEAKCEGATVDDARLGSYNFLRYASDEPSAFVVANVDPEGRAICNTARPDYKRAGALAFQGGIQDDCGTSFAAPRIAWLLAANERYKSGEIEDAYFWGYWLRKRVAPSREAGACTLPDDLNCLVPQPEQLFPNLVPKP
ncbi:hypothetical protein ACWKW4_20850 [Hydrogenophaga borbori]